MGLGYGARSTIGRHQATMRAIAAKSRPIMGAIFLATGLALFFSLHHVIEGWLLSVMPAWLIDLSVSV